MECFARFRTATWPSARSGREENGVAIVARKLVANGVLGVAVAAAAVLAAGPPALAMPAKTAALAAARPLTWTSAPVPNPPETAFNSFRIQALSCASATACVGGGGYQQTSRNRAAALLTLSGTTWTATVAPLPSGAATTSQLDTTAVNGVSCPSAARCFAGGGYQTSAGRAAGMLLTLSGGTWSAITAPVPSPGGPADVAAISCPSTKSCTAVGVYSDSSEDPEDAPSLLLHLAHGQWTAARAPTPADSNGVTALRAVSCPSATRCVAGGFQQIAGTSAEQPELLAWAKNQWTVVNAPLPPNEAADPFASITGVSCATAKRCVAVGSYTDSAGNTQGFLMTLSGKTWTTQEAPLPADASAQPEAQLNAVSCPTASGCTAGGSYTTTDNDHLGLILSRTGKTWTAIAAPSTTDSVRAVSCPSHATCEALGAAPDQTVALTGTRS